MGKLIKVWNKKGKYSGVMSVRNFKDIERVDKVYSRWEWYKV